MGSILRHLNATRTKLTAIRITPMRLSQEVLRLATQSSEPRYPLRDALPTLRDALHPASRVTINANRVALM